MKQQLILQVRILSVGGDELGEATKMIALDDDLLTRMDPDRLQDRFVRDVGTIASEAYINAFPRKLRH